MDVGQEQWALQMDEQEKGKWNDVGSYQYRQRKKSEKM